MGEDDDARTLKFMKSNYGPKGKPMALRYKFGLFVPDAATSAKTPAEADAMFLVMLDKYTDQGRLVSANKSSTYAPKVFADDKGCGFRSSDLKDAMDRLLEQKEIRAELYGPPSRQRTKAGAGIMIPTAPSDRLPSASDRANRVCSHPPITPVGWNTNRVGRNRPRGSTSVAG